MSLAEELMADFEEDDTDDIEQAIEVVNGEEDIEEASEFAPVKSDYNSVYDVAKMTLTDEYRELISTLNSELERTDEVHVTAPLESDPQYRLIVRLSHVSVSVFDFSFPCLL
uniref:RWD domain-containing protein n=1 Tax=Angiostrongylus cantonensis TaxID=6313 RepID=A0A0K0DCE3_ANGCA